MRDFQPEHIKLLEKASLAGHHLCGQSSGNCRLLNLCEASQAGYKQQCPAFGLQMPRQILKKSINRLPAILSTVQSIVYPLTCSLFRLGWQVW